MKRALVFMLAFFASIGMSLAVPAIKKPVTLKQADGTTITLFIKGDESTKWHETLDGYSLLEVNRQFYYAVQDKNGNMVASKVKAHDQDQRTRQEKKLLKKTPKQLRYSPQQLQKMRAKGPVAFANDPARTLANSPLAKAIKTRKNLTEPVVRRAPIILVNFADTKIETPTENYHKLINTRNYTENGCTGSFLDYFLDNSRGLFRFEADVIGPVTLSKDMAYYGKNTEGAGSDENPQEMVVEACRLALQSGVDFSQYDFDEDGLVDGVHIIFPGKGEEIGGGSDAVWSHMWNVDETVDLDGVYLYTYSCSSELSYYGDWDCIGTPVHELSHVFGLPDLYDTDYEDNGGESVHPDEFDVMSGGSYNNDSRTPPLHNAWSRIQMGWLEPVELTEACKVELLPAEQATTAFYYNTPVAGEYFVLDYRGEESKWDEYIPGHGMLIFAVNKNVKVDYGGFQVDAWGDYNCINCVPENRGFYIKQANGGMESNEYMGSGTPFPGSTDNTAFTDQTAPASTTHAGQKTNKPITGITELEEGGVSFVFIERSNIVRDNLGHVRTDSGSVTERVADPVFTPNGGIVATGTKVTITSATADATILYTQDGRDPAVSGTEYTTPVTIDRAMTLKAVAIKESMENSKTVSATYTISSVANEGEEQTGIKVYPNPNNGNFHIELPETAEVSVFSNNGSLLGKQNLRDGLHEMRLDKSGSYILRIRTSRASVSKRVIVR